MLLKSTDWNTIENFEDNDGKVHHVATGRSVFSKLPQVLMISFDSKSHIKIIENLLIQDYEYYVSFVKRRNKWNLIDDETIKEHELPEEGGFYFMVYNLKTPSS